RVCHPARHDFIVTAVENEERDAQRADGSVCVEDLSGEEVERQTRPRHAREVLKIRERRLENQSIERMMKTDLRRDRAAERVSIQQRRKVLRADLIVKFCCGDRISDDAGERWPSGALAEAAVVEHEDVEADVEQM